jgi:predicted metal-dependent HD superfamily phosphohydrolase
MFDDIVDNSYDQLSNDIRAEQALERNQDLIMGRVDLHPYQQRLQQQRIFLLEKFPVIMQEKFINQCQAILRSAASQGSKISI